MPTYARLCTYVAHACAAGILAVPFALRWVYPIPPGAKPQTAIDVTILVLDSIMAAARGAWALALVSGLVVSAIVLVLVAYLGTWRARGTPAERRRCLLPLLACGVAVVACEMIDARLPEFRP